MSEAPINPQTGRLRPYVKAALIHASERRFVEKETGTHYTPWRVECYSCLAVFPLDLNHCPTCGHNADSARPLFETVKLPRVS